MLPRESLARTGALVRHNVLLMLREPGPLLSRLIMPLAFLTLLRPLYVSAQGRTAGTQQAVIGTLVTFSLLALSISGNAILTERLGRTWDRLRGTPLRPAEMLVGKAIPVFAILFAQQILGQPGGGNRAAARLGRARRDDLRCGSHDSGAAAEAAEPAPR